MKIEIAESMVYSWLRKVRGCRLVQTNWKPAPEWPLVHVDELERLKAASETYFADVLKNMEDVRNADADAIPYESGDTVTDTSAASSSVFKRTANLQQLIAQTECDVLGLNFEEGKFKAIAVEVAFHEGGLNYSGGRKESAKKIASKFLRTIIALRACFGVEEAELIFASPHVKKATLQQVNQMMDELNAFLAKENLTGFSVSVLFNDDFKTELIIPLFQSVERHGAADGSELFVRAIQLIALGEKLPRLACTEFEKVGEKQDDCKVVHRTIAAKCGDVSVSAKKSQRMAFKEWMIARGIAPNTANSYTSGVNTSSDFARTKLGMDVDFYSMTDVDEVAEKVRTLLNEPSYRQYSKESNDSRKCGIERYAEFVAEMSKEQ